jgi:hypothetical protein
MRRNVKLGLAAIICLLVPFTPQGTAISQEPSQFVDTGVIFSAQQIECSERMRRCFGAVRPFWTPSPEEIGRLNINGEA